MSARASTEPEPRATPSDERVAAVRRFNRFYTRLVGALGEGHLELALSLTEARVLYEVAHRQAPTAAELGADLRLDPGYLSRILARFEKDGLLVRTRSDVDARRTHLALTPAGRKRFSELDARAHGSVADLLAPLDDAAQRRLLDAMRTVETVLGGQARTARDAAYVLRAHRPGDMGWVVHRHGILYHEEYGWDERFEALVARTVADFVQHFDPAREHCWIAERDERIVGSVFVVRHPGREGVAKLRLLYVEPTERGRGLGRRLVREVTRFARGAGYRAITLWTNSVLLPARHIYEGEGYRLVESTPHDMFGTGLVGETWELAL